ncbi:30S ribosomal protein S13 [Candidatus Woesearchaeota archaeon]|nr:30S ribosomal protein S13 [Candidatus Woesearchaeota archaeon]
MPEEKDFKHLVRIANTDLDGNRAVLQALRKIKGVNFMFSNAVCNILGIDHAKKAGNLTDDEIKKLSDIIENPLKSNIPEWLANRRKDMADGTSKHLLSGDLRFQQENDIKILRKIRCYRGMRHSYGLPVRGQRTKSNFRKNKGSVSLGVKKKSGVKAGRV